MNSGNLGAYNIEDLRQMAKKRLPRCIFEYVDGAAEDGIALQHNREVYRSLKIKNRVQKDVSKRSTAIEIFGKKIAMPYAISPTASAGLMSEGGEVGLAKAAHRMGVPCTVATSAVTPMEEIYEAAPGANLWFQLYMWVDVKQRMAFVERVKSVGFETLLVTVDGSVGANREHDRRNGYSMPQRYTPKLIAQVLAKPGWCLRVLAPQYLKRGPFRKANYPLEWGNKLTDAPNDHELTKPDTQCWDDIKRIRDMWPGHMLVKGLQSLEDALIAADYGLDGVVLSNHGGRYLDSAPAPLQLVPEVRRAVGDRLKDAAPADAVGTQAILDVGAEFPFGQDAGGAQVDDDEQRERHHQDRHPELRAEEALSSVGEQVPERRDQRNRQDRRRTETAKHHPAVADDAVHRRGRFVAR